MNDSPYRTAAQAEVPLHPIETALASYAAPEIARDLIGVLLNICRNDVLAEDPPMVLIDDLGYWRPHLERHFSREVATRILSGEHLERTP